MNTSLSTVCMAVFLSATLEAQSTTPRFTLSFNPCPSEVHALPAQTFDRAFDCILTTEDNPDPVGGAQGWSLSLSGDALDFKSATTQGTLAARITDSPPGLFNGGFEKTELARAEKGSGDCAGREGIVSAVVLSFSLPVTLPPNGPAAVCRFTVEGTAPATEGGTATARLFYVDGCTGSG